MGIVALLKLLYDSRVLMIAPGWAALVVLGYVEAFQLPPLNEEISGVKDSVEALQLAQLEQRLDATYTALCMNPGDSAVLERIRELQQDYEKLSGKRYPPPDCDLLLKLK
jgi:hypothetical protein